MITISTHIHSAFDQYPVFLRGLEAEFGSDGAASAAAEIINAELADFYWDGRIAEINLEPIPAEDDLDDERLRVAILGFFRGGYYVAVCEVTEYREVFGLLDLHRFDSFERASAAFLAAW